METASIILKLLITFIAAFLFGYQRQRSHKPVGFGTFIFVALGSCALGIFALSTAFEDPVPLIAGVVTGIGFLGAGALIKGADKVFGFTTAAAIWLFAILGMLIGSGEYLIPGVIYLFVWLVILFDAYLEIKGIGSYQKRIKVVIKGIKNQEKLIEYLAKYSKKHKIISVEVNKKDNEVKFAYIVEGTGENIKLMIQLLLKEKWVKVCTLE